jgi:hypothetical protein
MGLPRHGMPGSLFLNNKKDFFHTIRGFSEIIPVPGKLAHQVVAKQR